ncbi:putative mitochondrial mitochondrial RNA binding complex 1 subunit [Leptomonas pyrrhocoris]|uniref:Putative mitochondrial mitochondrial RNA binding complex 1 subunit n=1 Tax=Leptomonas pyrrhocoris TaxID=157538 RepID=A0A0N0DV01_LEPPY|nr:putative mitochondrial mitochondrial RNA binding complex 1 subunit [Leptomonas pyrrhocoris]KPA79641.1 putative mitochondrial mitochondrial RNA binding complex 1 subunit [Leptomonas pyrrhocoris]|eukprot:XP_015658080.1 putative mitochondrial mitochondrial RNA binding complex 1 subunit [Leptomonas pyrrhocoris]
MSSYYRGRGGGRGGAPGRHRGNGRGGSGFPRGPRSSANVAASEFEEVGAASAGSYDDSEGSHGAYDVFQEHPSVAPPGQPCSALTSFLNEVEGRSYAQLKQLTGQTFGLTPQMMPGPGSVTVRFLRIQPDPFAPGSQIHVSLPAPFCTHTLLHASQSTPILSHKATTTTAAAAAAVPPEHVPWRRVAAEDFLLRCVRQGLARLQGSSAIQMLQVSQHVLPRSTVQLVESGSDDAAHLRDAPNGFIHVFLRVKLPGHGRRIDSHGIHRIIFSELLPVFQNYVARCRHEDLWAQVTSVSDQEWLRGQLHASGLVAFIADGAVLPRAAGDSDLPLSDTTVIPFSSPPSLSRTFVLPYSGRAITGAGLRHGLTLIAGGGFHGKSTLLRALELGVYNHVPDDGRTFVVVDPTAVKIRAEDRRAVHGVDISPFIRHLPFRSDTTAFSTGDASGSTSQAANIMEALELGSSALLMDEDTSATNFMYRDALMEQLVPSTQEPITSFVHRVGDLMQHHKVSVILVVGGSGQYFPAADVVLVMNAYHVRDATAQAKEIVRRSCSTDADNRSNTIRGGLVESAAVQLSPTSAFHLPPQRHFQYDASFEELARRSRQGPGGGLKVSGSGTERVRVGHETIELSLVEQLVEEGQLNAIAQCLAMLYDGERLASEKLQRERVPAPAYPPPLCTAGVFTANGASRPSLARLAVASDYSQLVHNCEGRLRQARLELQTPSCYLPAGFTALPRVFELGAALNRLRTLITACR